MFGTFKRRTVDLPDDADAADILAELVKQPKAHGLSPEQAGVLTEAMVNLDKMDKTIRGAFRYKMRCRQLLIEWRNAMPEDHRSIATGLIDELDATDGAAGQGEQRLSLWFGLSYAAFAVLPRVMMNRMSDAWQERMVHLLEEFNEAFPQVDDDAMSFKVRGEGPGGRMAKLHPALTNYRHPDHETLDRWQRQPIHDWAQFVDAVLSLADRTPDTGEIANALASLNTTDSQSPDLNWDNAERVAAIINGDAK